MVLIGLSGALGLLSLVLIVLLFRRAGLAADERITAAVADMETRMEAMVRELSQALERAEAESERSRMLGEVVASIDLDQVFSTALEAALGVPGIDAAMVTVQDADDGPLIATRGMTADEAAQQPSGQRPDGPAARAVQLHYRYAVDEAGESLIRGGLMLPLLDDDGAFLGTLSVFWRSIDRDVSTEQLALLDDLARRVGSGVANALRFRRAQQAADIDALTQLFNRRFFHETLERELARAHRYGRKMALVILDIDNFKGINERLGHLGGDQVLAELGVRMRGLVRSTDIACRVGGEEFAVIMPESALPDAEQLYARLQRSLTTKPVGRAGTLSLSAGAAEIRPEDDAISLFERADAALYHAKQAGKGRIANVADA